MLGVLLSTVMIGIDVASAKTHPTVDMMTMYFLAAQVLGSCVFLITVKEKVGAHLEEQLKHFLHFSSSTYNDMK